MSQQAGGLNSVTLVGRVGQDPEIRYFESGSVKATLSVAVNRRFGKEEKADWFRVEVWAKQAEFVAEWVKKGALIGVMGTMELNRWTAKEGGTREYPLIRAADIRFVGGKRESQQGQDQGGFQQQQQPAAAF